MIHIHIDACGELALIATFAIAATIVTAMLLIEPPGVPSPLIGRRRPSHHWVLTSGRGRGGGSGRRRPR